MKKRRASWFLVSASLLAVVVMFLTASLLAGLSGANQEYQFTASLGGLEYNESFLDTAAKIPGIRQISPVLELQARLKIGDYTMDTTLQAVDIEVLDKKVLAARETPLGDTPVLLLGRDSLSEMRDFNDHGISREQQEKFLKDYENLEAELCVISQNSSGENDMPQRWQECIVAGILDTPAAGIYIPFEQGEMLSGNKGMAKIEKVLLTVTGKENYEKAQKIFT